MLRLVLRIKIIPAVIQLGRPETAWFSNMLDNPAPLRLFLGTNLAGRRSGGAAAAVHCDGLDFTVAMLGAADYQRRRFLRRQSLPGPYAPNSFRLPVGLFLRPGCIL